MALVDDVKAKAKLYLVETDDESTYDDNFMFPTSIVDFVVEFAIEQCHFPSRFKEQDIEDVLKKYTSSLAMACVDVYLKVGLEGQTSYSSNNYQRNFKSEWITPSLLNNLPNYVSSI